MNKHKNKIIIISILFLLIPAALFIICKLTTNASKITPIAQCVTINSDNTYTAYFSYRSKDDNIVSVPQGHSNNISGSIATPEIITSFKPGPTPSLTASPIRITAESQNTVTWTLGSKKVSLSSQSTKCPVVNLPRSGSATVSRPNLSLSDSSYKYKVSDTVKNMIPGDSQQRAFSLYKTTAVGNDNLQLKVGTNTSNYLTNNAVGGLQIKLDRCQKPWVEKDGAKPSYSCPKGAGMGTLFSGSLKSAIDGVDLGTIPDLESGSSLYLRWTWLLPTSSPNDSKGLSVSASKLFTYKSDPATKIYIAWEPSSPSNTYKLYRGSELIYTGTHPYFLDAPPNNVSLQYYIEALDSRDNSSGKSFLVSVVNN